MLARLADLVDPVSEADSGRLVRGIEPDQGDRTHARTLPAGSTSSRRIDSRDYSLEEFDKGYTLVSIYVA
jgi:hypothetical protein